MNKFVENAIIILLGVIAACIDMYIYGPTGFRPSELLLLFIWISELLIKLKLNKSVAPIIGVFVPLILIFYMHGSPYDWFLKLLVLVVICITVLNDSYSIFVRLSIGVLAGYTIYSSWLVMTGEAYMAKYSAVQVSYFLALFFFSRSSISKMFSGVAIALGYFIALTSNSRGQLLLFYGILLFLLAFYISPKLKNFSRSFTSAAFYLPVLSPGVKYLYYFLAGSWVESNIDINAGDIERAVLGIYAISSLLDYPLGQSAEGISDRAALALSDFTTRELNTVSAHNVIEDSMLFGGVAGLILTLMAGYILKLNVVRNLNQLPQTLIVAFMASIFIVSFVVSTSPVAGLERVEIMSILGLIGVAKFKYGSNRT